jgi:hypothetical protein
MKASKLALTGALLTAAVALTFGGQTAEAAARRDQGCSRATRVIAAPV